MIARDLRHAVRSLARSPGFLLLGALSLALALGLVTTTFAVLAVSLHPDTAARDPDRVFIVFLVGDGHSGHVTAAERYDRLRRLGGAFRDIGFVAQRAESLRTARGFQRVNVGVVSPSFFRVLEMTPFTGRWFRYTGGSDADESGIVVNYEMWQQVLGGRSLDSNAVLTVGDRTYHVIGVVPPGGVPGWLGSAWVLAPPGARETGEGLPLRLNLTRPGLVPIVRLRSGVTEQEAKSALQGVAASLTADYGTGVREFAGYLLPYQGGRGRLTGFHFGMAGAALFVLLIVCANMANLMLARAMAKRRDLAVRLAMGATRRALARQLATEAALVVFVGGALGVLAAVWGIHFFRHYLPPSLPNFGVLRPYLSWPIFAFAFAVTACTALVVAIVPAWRASDVAVHEPLKDTAGTTTGRTRHAYAPYVVLEVALALSVLMSAGILVRTAQHAAARDFGYESRGLLEAQVGLPWGLGREAVEQSYADLVDRAQHVAGVKAAAWETGRRGGLIRSDAGVVPNVTGQAFISWISIVSADYLRTLGIPIVAGRDFEEGDLAAGGAVVLDEEGARRLGPDGKVVGHLVHLPKLGWLRVVGVAREAGVRGLGAGLAKEPAIYVTAPQPRALARNIVVRASEADAPAVAVHLQGALETALEGRARVAVVRWRQAFDDRVTLRRTLAALFTAVGLFALALAAVGVYGVLSYTTNQRMREFGVRIAVGATPHDLVRLVLHQGALLLLGGTAIGGFLAMWAAGLLGNMLYDVPQTDAISLVAAEFVLLLVGAVACAVPAWRAMRADPVEILRAT